MYIFPEFIDMGLMKGQEWPSPEHRQVAQNIALCNPSVTQKDSLVEVCQAVIKIPADRIKLVTLTDCRDEFNVPFIY